jgi:hypothetical protein
MRQNDGPSGKTSEESGSLEPGPSAYIAMFTRWRRIGYARRSIAPAKACKKSSDVNSDQELLLHSLPTRTD